VTFDFIAYLTTQERMRREFSVSDSPEMPASVHRPGVSSWRFSVAALLRRVADRLEPAPLAAECAGSIGAW
jgi:hypothetical protein